MAMNWEQLLSAKRIGKEASSKQRDLARSEFQRDYDRLVFSSAFRRLQDKTQLFPLAHSDYVRTRLTHSLEVASLGRSLGMAAGKYVIFDRALLDSQVFSPHDFGDIVAAACLAHDIGNPPFGHAGEDAISIWFRSHKSDLERLFPPKIVNDFTNFEGNAQGFRVLNRVQIPKQEYGMQLTCATLGAFLKYPFDIDSRPSQDGRTKFGAFQSEVDILRDVASELGLINSGNNRWCRHPLAYLVEAADDIINTVIDLEDSYRMGLFSFEETRELLLPLIHEDDPDLREYRSACDLETQRDIISRCRAKAIRCLVGTAGRLFAHYHDSMLEGHDLPSDLLDASELKGALDVVKKVKAERVFTSAGILKVEIAGYEVISGLLNEFLSLTLEEEKSVLKTEKRKKVDKLLPAQPTKPYASSISLNSGPREKYELILRTVDFISGMTDNYALDLYKEMKGVSL